MPGVQNNKSVTLVILNHHS